MKRRYSIVSAAAALLFFLFACTEENTYITSPEDWQPPVVEWLSVPDAEVRGTVGLDVDVTDSSAVVRVRLYLDGREDQTLTTPPYRFEIVTDSLLDGVHVCEARAWDEHGNLGISPILRMNVVNSVAQGPQLIWVPDDFERIQDAINAATHHDTIRVRQGTYYEALNTFGKGVWIESQSGPMTTRINGIASNSVFTISPSDVVGTVRGFWLEGAERLVRYELGGQMNFYNNVFLDDTASALLYTTYSGGHIRNNLFSGGDYMIQIGYHWGDFFNNIMQDARNAALWNAAIATNPLVYGYNLFWNNGYNYDEFDPGEGDISADPLLDLVNGRLGEGSPCVNAGKPDILDLDSTRSDIGLFGGPWAYR
ncbi:hypothetical protein KKH27_06320 [bacterium]|nr:hypothetical protein [bacterium]MBU1983561.1 hypothetical protein [bacterium]